MKKFNKFYIGFIIGLVLPFLCMWLYLWRLDSDYAGLISTLKSIFPNLLSSILLGKILILSVFPNLILTFAFYKIDSFRLSTGFLLSAMPYLIGSIFML